MPVFCLFFPTVPKVSKVRWIHEMLRGSAWEGLLVRYRIGRKNNLIMQKEKKRRKTNLNYRLSIFFKTIHSPSLVVRAYVKHAYMKCIKDVLNLTTFNRAHVHFTPYTGVFIVWTLRALWYRIYMDTGCRIKDTNYRIYDTEYTIYMDTGCRMKDKNYRIYVLCRVWIEGIQHCPKWNILNMN